MRFDRFFKRTLRIAYGDQNDISTTGPVIPFLLEHTADREDLRVVFSYTRTTTGDADRAIIDIYNLPDNIARSIRTDLNDLHNLRRDIQNRRELSDQQRADFLKPVVNGYRVGIFAGYNGQDQLAFRGDLMKVTLFPPKRSGDTITRIELGDTMYALRDSYLRTSFGSNTFVASLVEASQRAAALDLDEGSKVFISALLPNARIAQVKNGWVGTSRVADHIEAFAAMYGVQWWVRDGVLFFSPRGSVIKDFSVVLTQGKDLLDFTAPSDYGDVRGRALLNPNLVPGRGLILVDKKGKRINELGYRINSVNARGDTHGTPWYVDFDASGVDSSVLSPSVTFDSEGIEIGVSGGLQF